MRDQEIPLLQRQGDVKCTSLIWYTLEPHASSMLCHNSISNVESQAQTFPFSFLRETCAIEALKDVGLIFLADATSSILYRNDDLRDRVLTSGDRHCHRRIGWAVLQSIVDEII